MNRIVAALLALILLEVPAMAAPDWNGTWVGNWADGDGVQIIMAGNTVTGLFRHGDYLPDDLHAAVSDDGKTLTITGGGLQVVLTRVDDAHANAAISEPGKPDEKFPVALDK
jgi:hypothetical protein